MSEIIKLNGLTKVYGKKKVVENFNLSIEKGHIYGLIGPNGSGKTTTMKMIAGTVLQTEGSIELFGKGGDITKSRARCSFMIEAPYLLGDLSARENLEYIKRLRGIPDENKVDEILELIGLSHTGKKQVKRFSLGMKQRLGLGMALMPDPEVMILDEPINGLDPEGIVEIRLLLKKLSEERGITILISSHILSELSELCTDFTFIDKGQMLENISKDELFEKCRSYIEVAADDVEKLTTVLEQELNIKDYKVNENNDVYIYEALDDIYNISKTIAENKIVMLKLGTKSESLEQYYLSRVSPAEEDDGAPNGIFANLLRKVGK